MRRSLPSLSILLVFNTFFLFASAVLQINDPNGQTCKPKEPCPLTWENVPGKGPTLKEMGRTNVSLSWGKDGTTVVQPLFTRDFTKDETQQTFFFVNPKVGADGSHYQIVFVSDKLLRDDDSGLPYTIWSGTFTMKGMTGQNPTYNDSTPIRVNSPTFYTQDNSIPLTKVDGHTSSSHVAHTTSASSSSPDPTPSSSNTSSASSSDTGSSTTPSSSASDASSSTTPSSSASDASSSTTPSSSASDASSSTTPSSSASDADSSTTPSPSPDPSSSSDDSSATAAVPSTTTSSDTTTATAASATAATTTTSSESNNRRRDTFFTKQVTSDAVHIAKGRQTGFGTAAAAALIVFGFALVL